MKKLSIKQALYDILSVSEQLPRILKDYPQYKDMLQLLTEKNYYDNYDLSLPTIKNLQDKLELKTHIIRKQLKEIYNIVFPFNNATLQFNIVEYHFTLSFMGEFFGFVLNELPIIPRIGDNITVPFASAALGFDTFFVDNVNYTLKGDKQIVNLTLKAGYSNHYLRLRKDKAQVLGELSRQEVREMNNYDMEKKVRKGELSP